MFYLYVFYSVLIIISLVLPLELLITFIIIQSVSAYIFRTAFAIVFGTLFFLLIISFIKYYH